MPESKEAVERVLLPLQLSLGIFQIMKTTPLWAVIHCTIASFLNWIYFPYTDYKQLQGFQGRVFKKVISHATTAGDVSKLKKQKEPKKSNNPDEISAEPKNGGSVKVDYLGKKFVLERKGGEMRYMEDGPAYYITEKMWETVLYIEKVAAKTVFVKNHKEIWEEVVTGDIMEFEEVLDSVILDNRSVVRLDHDYFLPINLLLAEDKLQRTLNFVGVFLQTQKHIHWLIPASLSFTSAVMGFSTTLRLSIVGYISIILCRGVQVLCDLLPLAMRRWTYFWGNWVENLKPSNDLESKIVSGKTCALVAAGAKLHSECLANFKTLADGDKIPALVGGGAKAQLETLADCESLSELVILADQDNIPALVGGGAKAHLQTLADCESLSELVILSDRDNIRALLTGSAKAKAQPQLPADFESLESHLNPKVGPFLFKCDSKCDMKCNSKCFSVYIEWVFDNAQKLCSLKAGRVASQESLKAHNIYIVPDDDDCGWAKDIKFFKSASCCGKEEHNKSLIADNFDTTSVDVECSSKEAIKLFKFAFYMAEQKSGSLKSYDPKTNKVYVRRFVESINAYVRSRYPPLYKLHKLKNVVVR